ncbi:MAG: recombinase family protein [Candidatus Acidiferrales bacterium]
MTANLLVPAAQYIRMSTEHQQYSLENQSAAIQKYAESKGFEVVRTYSDAARSGLVLRHRTGLRQLLQDVVGGTPAYRAILVYDVSRWGRFQDTDESAHYEFLCKSAGVPVHYCAEAFANNGTPHHEGVEENYGGRVQPRIGRQGARRTEAAGTSRV